MDNKKDVKVDFIVYESTMNRLERTNKRMFNLNIILIIVLFLVIAGIIVYSMIPSSTIEADQTAHGNDIRQNVGD